MRERVFPGLVVLLGAGLTGVFLTGDLFNFYVFFELSMTAAYILATYGGTRRELGAALVFTTVNLLGTFVFLLSVAGALPRHRHAGHGARSRRAWRTSTPTPRS